MRGIGAARGFLPPAVAAAGKRLLAGRFDPRKRYTRDGMVPWSQFYIPYKHRVVEEALQQPELLRRFAHDEELPSGYGYAVDERCVEYPWVVSRLAAGPARLLDAGSTLNYEYLVDHPSVAEKHVHIVTLGPEKRCYWNRGVSYLYEDLRRLPVRNGWYDVAVCCSTLEHVGHDNSWYTGRPQDAEQDEGAFLAAGTELIRVVRPGGTIFVTVPYGRPQCFPTQHVFDADRLAALVEAMGPTTVSRSFYRYTAAGWKTATADECADVEYVGWAGRGQSSPGVEPDHAAAARAVACLQLVV